MNQWVFLSLQPVDCANASRTKRDTRAKVEDEEEQPATIELYSGLYVNENAEIIEGSDDSVFAEKVRSSL